MSEIAIQRILIVDDDPDLRDLVRLTLEPEGFDVVTAESSRAALDHLDQHGVPHLAVVDIRMPGGDGLSLCREIQKFCDLPVVMLSAVDEEDTVIRAIEEVAEDYVTKPFNPKELVARIKRILRRMGDFTHTLEPVSKIDDRLTLDFAGRQVLIDDRASSLTPTETKLLHILIRSTGRTVRTGFLLRRIWPLEEVFEDTLRVHVHRLRQKIEPDPAKPQYLRTERGVGYSFLRTS